MVDHGWKFPSSPAARGRLFGFVALAGLALVLAMQSGRYSIGRVIETSRPDAALRMSPNLPIALVAKADRQVGAARPSDKAVLASAHELARQSLLASGLNPAALRVAALTKVSSTASVARVLQIASQMSRRDIGTQLALMEMRVQAGDIAGALTEYDRLLRVSRNLDDVLFPTFLSASSDAAIRPMARKLLAIDPSWAPRLIQWSANNPNTLPLLAPLLSALPPRSSALSVDYASGVIEPLVEKGHLQEAFAANAAFRASAGASLRPFNWATLQTSDASADPIRGGGFTLFTAAQQSGDLFARLYHLPPGKYVLSFDLRHIQGEGSRLRVAINCAGASTVTPLAQQQFPVRAGRVAFAFPVRAAGCPFQWVRLNGASTRDVLDAELHDLTLTTDPRQET